MAIKSQFILREVFGDYYLFPYGQSISDQKPALRLNEAGILLWNSLLEDQSPDEMALLLQEHFASDKDYHRDVTDFLTRLHHASVLATPLPLDQIEEYFMEIGGLCLSFAGPRELLHPYLQSFFCPPQTAHQKMIIRPCVPSGTEYGTILIRNDELTLSESEEEYFFLYPPTARLQECRVKKDGSAAFFFLASPYDQALVEELFHAMRFSFLILAQYHSIFALHSASLLYKDKAWLFSGPSGIGKSTHTALWKELFHTPFLNGDLNLISMKDGVPMVYGLPWCGTSETYTTTSYPLGGIVLLGQGSENERIDITPSEQVLGVSNRLISPTWTKEKLDLCLEFSRALISEIPIYSYRCTKEPNAASILREIIDKETGL